MSLVMQALYRTVVVKKELSCLRSDPHLWSGALCSDWKDEVTDTNGQNEVSGASVWAQP